MPRCQHLPLAFAFSSVRRGGGLSPSNLGGFVKAIFRAIAAAAAATVVVALHGLLDFFAGPVPADVNVLVWGVVAAAGVYAANWLISKLGDAA